MTRIILHIGTHKTGTTSFQNFMVDTAELYRAQGVNFLLDSNNRINPGANRFIVANAVLRRSLMTGLRMRQKLVAPIPKDRIAVFDTLGQQVRDEKAPCQVISSEAFCFARTEGEKRWVGMMLDRIKVKPEIVVVFRNQKDWRQSWAGQVEKTDRLRMAGLHILAHGEGFSDIRNDWYFNHAAIIRFWKQFGPVQVVDYDEAVATHGSIIPALVDAMDLPLLGNPIAYWKNARK